MAVAVDTTFMVEAEVAGHPRHAPARRLLDELLERGEVLALAPQVLTEFIHIVTDDRRFSAPLTMSQALDRAQRWWQAREVSQVLPTAEAAPLFLQWMKQHRLGRKRLLDTMLAATYSAHGVTRLVTDNPRDYEIFRSFELLSP